MKRIKKIKLENEEYYINASFLDGESLQNIYAYIYEALYGFIDGTIENIVNNKATYIRDYAFYQH